MTTLATVMRLWGILAALALGGCAPGSGPPPADDEPLLECEGKCDGDTNLQVASRWVPREGFVRAQVASGATLKVSPAAGVTLKAVGTRTFIVEFPQEGFYDLTAVQGTGNLATLKVRVADEAPALTVDSPAARSFVPLAPVTLSGRLVDGLGRPVTAKINGLSSLQLDGSGRFSTTLTPRFGVNLVTIKALDAAGIPFTYGHSFMAAVSYRRAAQRAVARLDNAGLALLGQKLGPALPGLIKVPLTTTPVASKWGNDVYVDEILVPGQPGNPGSIAVALESRAGTLWGSVTMTGEVRVRGRLDWAIGGDSGYVAHLQSPRAEMTMRFQSTAAGVEILVDNITITDGGLNIEMDNIPDWFVNLFSGVIRTKLADAIKTKVPPMLRDALKSFAGQYTSNLNVLGKTVPIKLGYSLSAVTPAASRLAVALAATADGGGAAAASPGAPIYSDVVFGPSAMAGTLGVDVGYNLLNQYLHELWAGGAFKTALSPDALAAAVAKVPTVARLEPTLDVLADLGLPPVVEPDTGGGVFSLGGLAVELYVGTDLFQFTVVADLGARFRLNPSVEDGRIVVRPELLEVQVDIGRRAFSGLNTEAVEDLLRELAPSLATELASRLKAFNIPALDLTAVGLPGVRLGLDDANVAAQAQTLAIGGQLAVLQ